jgi:hypothetical protein
MPKLSGKQLWKEDELIVLSAIFANLGFAFGDDERKECKLIAKAFGRSPGTVGNGETLKIT